jgi:protein-tyrosine-phosphatase
VEIMITAEELAQKFHENYERLAPNHGYETRKESAKPWTDVPAKNKSLMIAVCAEILKEIKAHIKEGV